jgi:2',3'-cyclic-nucleotide 2'-phosphodiesterase (5'-nucleotidase family)
MPKVVASNVHFSATDPGDDELAALYGTGAGDKPIEPYRVVTTASGIKIGFFGYVGLDAAHSAPNSTPVSFSQANLPALFADLKPIVDKLRNDEKVDLVVALSHAGIGSLATADSIAAGEDSQVCAKVTGIDLVVSGHTHQRDPKPMPVTNPASSRPCLVLNGGVYGQDVGTVTFTVPADPSASPTYSDQAMVPVDESLVPDPAFDPQPKIEAIESQAVGGTTLASLLSHALGQTFTNDPAKAGDLYFHPVGSIGFDVKDPHVLSWLAADAMLSETDALGSETTLPPTQIAIESAATIRAVLAKGKTGKVSAADAFNVLPLGVSPVDGSYGIPLVRVFITVTELHSILELARAKAGAGGEFDLGVAGLKYEYDATRPPLTSATDLFDPKKGQVTKIWLDGNHTDGFEQYDQSFYVNGTSPQFDGRLVSAVTTIIIAAFASDAGVTLKDKDGVAIPLPNAILKHADGSEVKEPEALMRYLGSFSSGLPSTYDGSSPSVTKRVVCTGGC